MGRRLAGLTRGAAALVAAACALALVPAPAAPAQPVTTIYRTDADAALSERVAFGLERLALIDLRMRTNATPLDYQVAAMLFDYAMSLDPDNQELPRRIAAAAFAAGNERLLETATRRVVRLDPDDTVAQLRLISSLIAKQPTTESRLERYQEFLGPRGQRLDPSVRSRLALDAALLLRERGDLDGFVEHLTLAMDLDRTNKPAASLAVGFFAENVDDPVGLLDLQLDLLYADPLDPHVRRSIGTALAREGAYGPALRMIESMRSIHIKYASPPTEIEVERLSLRALYESPHQVLESLSNLRDGLRRRVEMQREAAEEQELPEEEWPDFDDARLPIEYERLRLSLAVAVGDEELTRESLGDITGAMADEIEALRVEGEEGTDRPPEVRFSEYVNAFMTAQAARALAGLELDEMNADLRSLVAEYPSGASLATFLEPWLLYHAGRYEEVLATSDQLEDASDARLIRARALEGLGRIEDATDIYIDLAHNTPFTPTGVWAALRVIEIAGESPLLTDDGRAMTDRADRLPEWLDRMIDQPSSYMALSIRPSATSIPTHEPAYVTITLRNTSPIPLGVGTDRVIGSRFLLAPSLDADIRGFVGEPHPEVLELDRRLRLNPRESISVTVPADPAYTGYLLELNAKLTIRQRWRLLQSFIAGPRAGAMVPDPLSMSAETGAVRRLSLPEARLTPDELAIRVRRDDPLTLPRTLVGIRAHLLGPGSEEARAGNLEPLVDALVERYEQGTAIERALMALELPHGRQVPAFERFDATARRLALGEGARDADGLVCAIVLLTRTVTPNDEIFAGARFSGIPRLMELGNIIDVRVKSGVTGFASAGPFVRDLVGPTPGRHRRSGSQVSADEGVEETP